VNRKVLAGGGLSVPASNIETIPAMLKNTNEKGFSARISELEAEIKKLKSRKKYGLVWEEKPEEVVELCKDKLPVLTENQTREIKNSLEKPVNIIIEGDNYHALSVLNYTHSGKIDLIYIDPPYNTGRKKEWRFNDKWIDSEDSYKHSKWLSFMQKRLALSKKLLKNNGVIFISIDDNEIGQLKVLCDEIFGENKLMGIIHWRKNRKPHNAGGTISKSAEFILVYSGGENIKLVQEYTIKDSDENGDYSEAPIIKADKKERIYLFPKGIVCDVSEVPKGINKSARNQKLYVEYLDKPNIKNGVLQNDVRIKARYCLTNERGRLDEEIRKGNIFINSNGVPKCRVYRVELLGKVANNLWTDKGYNEDAHEEISNIFNVDLASEIFDYPKPTKLIKEILKSLNRKDAIILDFFAGSGTTGHATLDLNNSDNGNRRFILCTSNENNIAEDVCYPRIKKVIKGYKNKDGKKIDGLGGNLKYFKADKADFVEARQTDLNKKKLVDKSTEMLCLKEDCFDLVKKGKDFKILTSNQDKYVGIIYDDAGIELFKKEIKKLNKIVSTYVFSLDDSAREEEFEDIKKLVDLKPIPAVILNVYKRIFK